MPKPNVRLREARLAAGLTQAEFCRRAGIPGGTYRPIEAGHKVPGRRTMFKIARALGRTVDELFAPENDPDGNTARAS